MKLSRWNSYICLDDRTGIIFNSFTKCFIASKSLNGDFDSARKGKITEFSDEFYQQMINSGCLVPDDKDEVLEVIDSLRRVDEDGADYHVIINPTLDCNFRCWYCYENHKVGSSMSELTINGILHHMEIVLGRESLKSLTLSFFGGEPLLRFNDVVKPIVERVGALCVDKSKLFGLQITTNGSLLDEEKVSFLSTYNPSFQITLDGGREQHNKTRFEKGGLPSFDRIIDAVRIAASNKLFVTLRINYTTAVIDSVKEIIDILLGFDKRYRQYISVDFQRVWQDKSGSAEDDTYRKARVYRKQLNDAGYCTPNNRLMDAVSFSCYGDKKNEILFNYNGDVFACSARDFKPENRLGVLNDNGSVSYDVKKYDEWRNVKFSKPICQSCRIGPMCGGGCRTRSIETADDPGCNLGLTEDNIDELILERFETHYL